MSTDRSLVRSSHWLENVWDFDLTPRDIVVLNGRQQGRTLDDIGRQIGTTRERVRQLESLAQSLLLLAAQAAVPDLLASLDDRFEQQAWIFDDDLSVLLSVDEVDDAVRALARALRLKTPEVWGLPLSGLWTRDPDEVQRRFDRLAKLAPFDEDELGDICKDIGLDSGVPISSVLLAPGSKLVASPWGWVRRGRLGRDTAFLFLQAEGEPRTVEDIAAAAGIAEHAMRETMRRNADAFAQVRPELTWGLADWRVPGVEKRYASALDVVIEVLREVGPMSLKDLREETQRRYPVSSARVSQCLISDQIGLTTGGLLDLTERGAVQALEPEPRKPASMTASGETIGVELLVDRDVLRGSGVIVHRWLAWQLGLRSAPSARFFTLDGENELAVRRSTSSVQLSSLRSIVLEMGLEAGCSLVVLLETSNSSAKVRHVCRAGACAIRA
jgi:hypothetical protein